MIILFKYCVDIENYESFKGFSYIYCGGAKTFYLNKMIILFKYCVDIENYESFKGFSYIYCGGAKTWALAVGLSTTFYQQCVRGEEIIGKPRN